MKGTVLVLERLHGDQQKCIIVSEDDRIEPQLSLPSAVEWQIRRQHLCSRRLLEIARASKGQIKILFPGWQYCALRRVTGEKRVSHWSELHIGFLSAADLNERVCPLCACWSPLTWWSCFRKQLPRVLSPSPAPLSAWKVFLSDSLEVKPFQPANSSVRSAGTCLALRPSPSTAFIFTMDLSFLPVKPK